MSSLSATTNILPIAKLNFLKQNTVWKIKATVYFKSEIRTFKKSARTTGNFFTVELRDETDAIKGVAFNIACDMLYSKLEVNKTYYISRCSIRRADRRYNTLSHNYELVFEEHSQISLCSSAILPPTFQTKKKTNEPVKKIWILYELPSKLYNATRRDLFHVEGIILDIKSELDEVVYAACPQDYCKKKVIRTEDKKAFYYCEKCNKKYPKFTYRYVLKLQIADWSGFVWVTLFGTAETFLGITADEMVYLYQQNRSLYESRLKSRLFQTHTFVLEAKMELHDDVNKVSGVGANYYQIDYAQSCRGLVHDIRRLIKTT
ncbi:replication protein A 70 kDa DNA-binding subunit-like [Planococcus citri]|uniref:replication protein A 70 kDa DNA-binding subunit-like n=1 Tax=Planococcus citri TaxID=170843 RepID=UPI0031F93C1A